MLLPSFLTSMMLLSEGGGVLCSELIIHNTNELINFSNNVNSGTNYSGTTVFLDSDIDFSGKTFNPIGNSTTSCFLGTFDGQGHTISNLVMNSIHTNYIGLFGKSTGTTIKNIVIDSSCSITSTYSQPSSMSHVGSIIGSCETQSNPCVVENAVSMENITFDTASKSDYISGGIAGYFTSYYGHNAIAKNCINYGAITYNGDYWSVTIGGIIGSTGGTSSSYSYVLNCANYGPITFIGSYSGNIYLAGLHGTSYSQSLRTA